MEQRPAAVRPLSRPDVSGDPSLKLGLDTPKIMLQQYVFGRYRRVGLKFEDPVTVRAPLRE
jgi:hypothetical protein